MLVRLQSADFVEKGASESMDLADRMGPLRAANGFQLVDQNIALVIRHFGPVVEEGALNVVDLPLVSRRSAFGLVLSCDFAQQVHFEIAQQAV